MRVCLTGVKQHTLKYIMTLKDNIFMKNKNHVLNIIMFKTS